MRRGVGRGRIIDGLVMLVMASVSLLLLLYIAFGEANHALTDFEVSKVVAQGQIIQSKVEEYLRSGQPLGQFAGFRSLAQPLLASDPTLASAVVRDPAANILFEAGNVAREKVRHLDPPSAAAYQVHQDSARLHVVLPLRNKFETVGSLVMSVSSALVTKTVRSALMPVVPWCVFLCVALTACACGIAHWSQERRIRWHRSLFAGAFLVVSVAVVWILVGLYSDGARAKVRALADSLDARLNEIVDLGLTINDFSGIHLALAEYRTQNADIGSVAVLEDGVSIHHTDTALQGKAWISDRSSFEFTAPLHLTGRTNSTQVVMVAMPSDVIYWAVARNVRNFMALFVATGLIALIFLKVADAQSRNVEGDSPAAGRKLETVEPVLFIGVFADNLSATFLPQLVTDSAHAAAAPPLAVSVVFLLYFLAFSLSVLPAESFAARRGPKPLILGGCVLVGLGAALLAVSHGFALVALARVLSGCGQGLLLIGVQSYIFSVAAPERRTRGNSIIVFNFNGGMIAGMAIGSLLVHDRNETVVFWLATILMTLLALYALLALPAMDKAAARPMPNKSDFWRVLVNRDFLECILLVGIPSKALLSGVVIFAMPLLLGKLKFRHEDIGQLVMFYAGGVMLANAVIARVAHLDTVTGRFLMRGMILSALGLAVIGVVGWSALIDFSSMPLVMAGMVLLGVAMLGVAHGFINAPVVTHVSTLPIAAVVGAGPVVALYRMVERLGHVIGPVLIGQLLIVGAFDLKVLLVPAGVVVALALMFRLRSAARVQAI